MKCKLGLVLLALLTQWSCTNKTDFVAGDSIDGLRIGLSAGKVLSSNAVFLVRIENVGRDWKSVRPMYPNVYIEVIDGAGSVVAKMSGDSFATPDKVSLIYGASITALPESSTLVIMLHGNSEVSDIEPGTYNIRAVLEISGEDWSKEIRAQFRGRADQLWTGECRSGSIQVSR